MDAGRAPLESQLRTLINVDGSRFGGFADALIAHEADVKTLCMPDGVESAPDDGPLGAPPA